MILRVSVLVLAFLFLAGYAKVKPQPQTNYGEVHLVHRLVAVMIPKTLLQTGSKHSALLGQGPEEIQVASYQPAGPGRGKQLFFER